MFRVCTTAALLRVAPQRVDLVSNTCPTDPTCGLKGPQACAKCVHGFKLLKSTLAFVLLSKLYWTPGIAIDSARIGRSAHWARWIAKLFRRLFIARPMPALKIPV